MKKIILVIAMILPMVNFAQEKKEEVKNYNPYSSLSFETTVSEPSTLGFTYETNRSFFHKRRNESLTVINLSIGGIVMTDNRNNEYVGNGFVIAYGTKNFLKKDTFKGWNIESLSSFGVIQFSDINYSGTYKYFAPLDFSLGYKFTIAKHLNIDPQIGCVWKWEIKSDVENKDFNNFVPKFGLKIGYAF